MLSPDQVFELFVEKGKSPRLEIDGEVFKGKPVQMTYIVYTNRQGVRNSMLCASKRAVTGNWMYLHHCCRCTDLAEKQGFFLKGNRGSFYGPLGGAQ